MTALLDLKYDRSDNGFVRIYYRFGKGKGAPLYCVQDEGGWGKRKWVVNRCSQDGEPSHSVAWDFIGQIERPRGGTDTDKELLTWLQSSALPLGFNLV